MASWRTGVPDGPSSLLGIGVILIVVLIDQAAKTLAEAMLPFAQAIDVLPFLALYRVHNTGIAFSMFAGSGVVVMTALVLFVLVVVVVYWARSHDGGRVAALGFAFIVGGALGNLADRLRFGHVVDFLLLHLGERTLFVFNLADAALTLGPALLLVVYLWPAPAET